MIETYLEVVRKSNKRTVPSSPQLINVCRSVGTVITSYVVPLLWQLKDFKLSFFGICDASDVSSVHITIPSPEHDTMVRSFD